MENFSKRIAALSPGQLELLKRRLKKEGIELENDLKDVEKSKFPAINPVEKKEYYPLSSVQKRLFVVDRFDDTGTTYNVPVFRTIAASPDKKRIEAIFKTLVKRHEAFRTSFELIAAEPAQRIHKDVEFKIEYYELDSQQSPGKDKILRDFIRPFDLNKAPVLRIGILKLSGSRFILMTDTHHILSDQASKRILFNEFIYVEKEENFPPLYIQYKDFSTWQNREAVKTALKQQEKYWLAEFSGEIPLLNLPTDYARPEKKGYQGGCLSFRIEKETAALLKALALKENTTLFVVMLAIYNVLLAKISRQKDIIVGVPTLGRRHAGLDFIIGMFVNTLPLRNYLEEDWQFIDFLQRVKKRTLDAFENQDYQFEDLVNKVVRDRDMSRNPIFDAFFTFTYPDVKNLQQQVLTDETEANPEAKETIAETGFSMFDIFLFGAELEEELLLGITYAADLFKKETIARFSEYFREILYTVTANNRIKLQDIKISHDLGTAREPVFRDEDDDFGF